MAALVAMSMHLVLPTLALGIAVSYFQEPEYPAAASGMRFPATAKTDDAQLTPTLLNQPTPTLLNQPPMAARTAAVMPALQKASASVAATPIGNVAAPLPVQRVASTVASIAATPSSSPEATLPAQKLAPVLAGQPQMVAKQAPSVQPGTAGFAPAVGQQPPAVGQSSPTGQQQLGAGQQAPFTGQQPVAAGQQTPFTGQQPAAAGQQGPRQAPLARPGQPGTSAEPVQPVAPGAAATMQPPAYQPAVAQPSSAGFPPVVPGQVPGGRPPTASPPAGSATVLEPTQCAEVCSSLPNPLSKEKPNVLIIGDQVSQGNGGYLAVVKTLLNGVASVQHAPMFNVDNPGGIPLGPCGSSIGADACMDTWLGEDTVWDVISFNWGLQDICPNMYGSITVDDYVMTVKKMYIKMYARLADKGKIIWHSTTPVPPDHALRKNKDVITLNQAVDKMWAKASAPPVLHDLYGSIVHACHLFTDSRCFPESCGCPSLQEPGSVKFSDDGNAFLGTLVANKIIEAL